MNFRKVFQIAISRHLVVVLAIVHDIWVDPLL